MTSNPAADLLLSVFFFCLPFSPSAMEKLTKDMCWTKIVHKVHVENGVAVAVFQKPTDNECYLARPEGTIPPCAPTKTAQTRPGEPRDHPTLQSSRAAYWSTLLVLREYTVTPLIWQPPLGPTSATLGL